MKNSQLVSVGVGVAVVVLAYAGYKVLNMKTGGGRPTVGAVNPGSLGFQAVNPGQALSTDELIYDAATKGQYDGYASTDDLIYNTIYGGAPASVMGDLSGWWNGH